MVCEFEEVAVCKLHSLVVSKWHPRHLRNHTLSLSNRASAVCKLRQCKLQTFANGTSAVCKLLANRTDLWANRSIHTQ
jgi:hypothetical protein